MREQGPGESPRSARAWRGYFKAMDLFMAAAPRAESDPAGWARAQRRLFRKRLVAILMLAREKERLGL